MADDVFVIAVKRDRRGEVPADWVDVVRGTSGLTVMGDANATRLQVRATPAAIEQVRTQLSDYLHIEKMIPHDL
jgi:hypothetical protein